MIGKIGTLALCAYSAFGCSNSALLRQYGHLDIGVKLAGNAAFILAETQALDYWSTVLDMAWHQDETDNCSIEFRPVSGIRSATGEVEAFAYQPRLKYFDGVVYFMYCNSYDKRLVFIHELGHLFGLEHSHNCESIMYPANPSHTSGQLDSDDIRDLKKIHSLR